MRIILFLSNRSIMDVSDDREIKLQQTSSSRLAEFEVSLPRLLWKSTLNEKAVPLGSNVRTLVKSTKAHDLVLLVSGVLCGLELEKFLICRYQVGTIPGMATVTRSQTKQPAATSYFRLSSLHLLPCQSLSIHPTQILAVALSTATSDL